MRIDDDVTGTIGVSGWSYAARPPQSARLERRSGTSSRALATRDRSSNGGIAQVCAHDVTGRSHVRRVSVFCCID